MYLEDETDKYASSSQPVDPNEPHTSIEDLYRDMEKENKGKTDPPLPAIAEIQESADMQSLKITQIFKDHGFEEYNSDPNLNLLFLRRTKGAPASRGIVTLHINTTMSPPRIELDTTANEMKYEPSFRNIIFEWLKNAGYKMIPTYRQDTEFEFKIENIS